ASPTTLGPSNLNDVKVIDLNGDSDLDLAAVSFASAGTVAQMLGNGAGAFAAPVSYPAASYPTAIALGQVNGDGTPDIAVSNGNNDHTVQLLLSIVPQLAISNVT